jgi:hypothetical protein
MTDLQKLLAEATRGPWELRTVSIPHYLQNERSPEPHHDRSIYTAWEHPQLKDGEPIVVIATGAPAVKGGEYVGFLHIDEANARLIAMAPELAARVIELEAENKRLREENEIARQALGHESGKYGNERTWQALQDMNQARAALKGGEI